MKLTLRWIKIGMILSNALFFSMIAFDNITDFQSNYLFVQHVLSMDTTFQRPTLMWRAITNGNLQTYAYYCIIAWESMTAIICWFGSIILLANIKNPPAVFNEAKKMAFIGLFFGFILYIVGFIIVGGLWFSMWQSQTWNGQMKAGLFINFIMFIMIFLAYED